MGILYMLQTQPMEALSQLDITNPDHVSVITRDGKMTVSVTKDGAAVTVSLPVRTTFNTNPPTPLQQAPELPPYKALVSKETTRSYPLRRARMVPNPNSKLTEAQVREIKAILADPDIMSKFRGTTHAYNEIGKAYKISGCAVSHIARGISWKHVKI